MDALLTPRRRSIFAPVWASGKLQATWCILQIRTGILIPWAIALVDMLVARQLWIALFNGREVYEGHTLNQTLAYVVLSMAFFGLMKGDEFLYWKIRSGNILFEMMYPLHFTNGLVAFSLASTLFQLIGQAIPQLLMAIFLLKIPLPASPTAWLAFSVSFLMGLLIFNCLDNLANMLGFWTTEMHGLLKWKDIIAGVLSGAVVPLWIFPDAVGRVIAWLPFRGMQYVPLSILVGWIRPEEYLREMGIQLAWVVALWLTVEVVYELARRKYEVQGG
jgi:ABC-2 type transport system permease protein